MNYKLFSETIMSGLNERMPECTVTTTSVLKNNGKRLTGIHIYKEGVTVSPTFYMEVLYEDYKRGETFDEILDYIKATFDESPSAADIDFSCFEDYSKLEGRVLCKVINKERNKEFLEDVPYYDFCDLAVVFYIMVSLNGDNGTVVLHNVHFRQLGVTLERIYEDAVRNTERLLGFHIMSISEMLTSLISNSERSDEEKELMLDELKREASKDVERMFVLTNDSKCLGSACMLMNEKLSMFADSIGSDFYILPSSIHELILIPDSGDIDASCLFAMVKETNDTEVMTSEVLSYNVYKYCAGDNTVIKLDEVA